VPIYTLQRKEIVGLPLAQCWDFFSNPANLEKITPPELGFAVKSSLPEKVYPGLMIEYTVSPLLGFKLSWLTEIVHVNEPYHFVDEQRVGPYRLWHHEHFFREISSNEVEVSDLIHYVPPFGLFGGIINALAVRPQLERIFDFRTEALKRILSRPGPDSFA
jgi:ligand-binding SRPBCC domain-containing protein